MWMNDLIFNKKEPLNIDFTFLSLSLSLSLALSSSYQNFLHTFPVNITQSPFLPSLFLSTFKYKIVNLTLSIAYQCQLLGQRLKRAGLCNVGHFIGQSTELAQFLRSRGRLAFIKHAQLFQVVEG